MNYLKITNDGLICAEDLMLIGSSTKREQTGKIGMFGSGWKYALAWLLRNDCKPIIMAGHNKIEIDYNVKLHRNTPVNVITVGGKETSLTTEMGPKWTGWMALREVLSNAIDEGNHTITTSWLPEYKGGDNSTTIYIPMSSELSEVMLKFYSYFAFYRKASWENESVRMFFKTEESNLNVYRKGIRCFDTNTRSKVDFDFNNLEINEDRLTTQTNIDRELQKIIKEGLPLNIFQSLLKEGRVEWLPYDLNESNLATLKELLESGHSFATPSLKRLCGELFSNPNSLLISDNWYKILQDMGLVKSPFANMVTKHNFIRTDARNVGGLAYLLKGWNLELPVFSGKTDTDCFYDNGSVYVKDDTTLQDKDLIGEMFYGMSKSEISELVRA